MLANLGNSLVRLCMQSLTLGRPLGISGLHFHLQPWLSLLPSVEWELGQQPVDSPQ
jgi:hypothetical protein